MVELDEAYDAETLGVAPGAYVVVAVSDTGVGMPADIVEKVFDPFFTSKPPGLGPSMVYGFAKQSNGQVRIHSHPGHGTSVKLYLPVAASAAKAHVEVPTGVAPLGSGQVVLVVESVRLLVREVLHELGYLSIEAADGLSAVPILASAQKIDLLISDVGLPGLNGRQLAELARQHKSDLPILFVTGYAAIRSGFLGTNMAMITKPLAFEILAAKVGEMMPAAGGQHHRLEGAGSARPGVFYTLRLLPQR